MLLPASPWAQAVCKYRESRKQAKVLSLPKHHGCTWTASARQTWTMKLCPRRGSRFAMPEWCRLRYGGRNASVVNTLMERHILDESLVSLCSSVCVSFLRQSCWWFSGLDKPWHSDRLIASFSSKQINGGLRRSFGGRGVPPCKDRGCGEAEAGRLEPL